MNAQHTTNPMALPDTLPRPEDDGGADHLTGMKMPGVALRATSGELVDLSALPGRIVVYAYPMTGVPNVELPPGWNDIPGARGCTPQTLSFQAEKDVFAALGVTVFGLSTQTPDYQQELADRLKVSFAILSDANFKLTEALRLPTMTVEGMRLIKRLTLVIDDGIITHAFYPVFPPDRATADVVAWLRENPAPGSAQAGVQIYTTLTCPHCKAAKALLTEMGIAFAEVNVDQDAAAADAMLARSGRKTVPQVFIHGRPIGGADELRALSQSGQLAGLLAEQNH
jgi:GrxC family glutaredoxin